ncbi:MAG: type II toxin-antitoxin system VapC family toxin [Armatimonadetes bacterium]|nr:type II toxin-antitoxin system VapC family toxin [Armatimonadota bacterium]
MVVDTSALVAILEQEQEARRFSEAIAAAENCLVSAATVVETGIVILARHGELGAAKVDRLLQEAQVEIIPVTEDHVRLAREGFSRFGKGRHPAGLNFGDCFSYALARATGLLLLFKGDDFSQTDVRPALPLPE